MNFNAATLSEVLKSQARHPPRAVRRLIYCCPSVHANYFLSKQRSVSGDVSANFSTMLVRKPFHELPAPRARMPNPAVPILMMKPRAKSPPRQSKKILTKEMLLPLSAAAARKKSLELHMALAALRSGDGSAQMIGRLLVATYVAYFVHEATVGRRDLGDFRAAEVALQSSAVSAKADAIWQISGDDCAAIEYVLAVHDQQLANIPRHVIASADERLNRFLTTDRLSPIAAD